MPEYSSKKRTRVLQVLYGGLGGAENMALTLATALQQNGVHTSVLCLQDGPFVDEVRELGLPVVVVAVRSPMDAAGISRLCAYLCEQRFDVVHTHLRRAMTVGNLAARLARVPAIVTTLHSLSYVDGRGLRDRLLARGEGVLARLCTDMCVAYSASIREDAVRGRAVPSDRVVVIRHGVSLERFRPETSAARRADARRRLGAGPDDLVIGAVGRLIGVKGHAHAVRALARIAQVLPAARLIIVGAGPLRDDLGRLAADAGVAERVIFAGDVRADRTVYAAMDSMVYPSVKGVFGLVVLEAMACGVPVVVSGLDGTDELVNHEQNGLLVPPGDERAMADAVVRIAVEPGLRERLVHNGLETVTERFSDVAMAHNYESLYESLAGRPE